MTAFIVVGLGFGDEGKGTIIDALAQKHGAHTVIRFNGGAQAAHNVVHDDGTHHTFNQFGAASFRGCDTYMTRDALFNPLMLKRETAILKQKGLSCASQMFKVHAKALVTTQYLMFLNGIRESARGADRHGSCGMGIGETMHFAELHAAEPFSEDRSIFARDLVGDISVLTKKVQTQRIMVLAQLEQILETVTDNGLREILVHKINVFMAEARLSAMIEDLCVPSDIVADEDYEDVLLRKPGNILLEGAQGVLLDETYGFNPYTTWSTTTFKNAEHFLARYRGDVIKIGVTRAYQTRHGAGPFPSESAEMTASLPDVENTLNKFQGGWRVGPLDMTLLEYAANIAQPDIIAVTCVDRVDYAAVPLALHRNRSHYLQHNVIFKPSLKESEEFQKEISNITSNNVFTETVNLQVFLGIISQRTCAPVGIISSGKTAADKKFLKVDHPIWDNQ